MASTSSIIVYKLSHKVHHTPQRKEPLGAWLTPWMVCHAPTLMGHLESGCRRSKDEKRNRNTRRALSVGATYLAAKLLQHCDEVSATLPVKPCHDADAVVPGVMDAIKERWERLSCDFFNLSQSSSFQQPPLQRPLRHSPPPSILHPPPRRRSPCFL